MRRRTGIGIYWARTGSEWNRQMAIAIKRLRHQLETDDDWESQYPALREIHEHLKDRFRPHRCIVCGSLLTRRQEKKDRHEHSRCGWIMRASLMWSVATEAADVFASLMAADTSLPPELRVAGQRWAAELRRACAGLRSWELHTGWHPRIIDNMGPTRAAANWRRYYKAKAEVQTKKRRKAKELRLLRSKSKGLVGDADGILDRQIEAVSDEDC